MCLDSYIDTREQENLFDIEKGKIAHIHIQETDILVQKK